MKGFGKAVWAGEDIWENPDTVREMAGRLKDAGFDLLLPLVKSLPGYLDWRTRIGKPNPAFRTHDVLETLSRECRRVGLRIHPWFCVFREGNGSALLERDGACAAQDEGGKAICDSGSSWLCAMQPAVHEYERGLMVEVMDNYDVDGVHLDYVRAGGFCCFCPRCRDAARQWADLPLERVKAEATTNPHAAEAYSRWMDWRRSRVTEFVRQVRQEALARGKEVSAAVLRNTHSSFELQAQDWVSWGREGLVDYLFPMNYTNSVAAARHAAMLHIAAVEGGCPIWEGLGKRSSLSCLSTERLVEQARGVREAGAQGIVIFSYAGIEESDWNALAAL